MENQSGGSLSTAMVDTVRRLDSKYGRAHQAMK
jgi:hypothetical protein